MSRIGKMPIALPAKVSISVDKGNFVTVNGPKGALKQQFDPDIKIEIERQPGQGAAPD
jgi:large subunit ribosomal protein L6